VLYSERVQPPVAILALAGVAGASFGLILVPLSPALAAVAATVLALACVAFALGASPVVEVDATTFRAGSARIEGRFLSGVEVLDRDGVRRALGVDADARAWVCHRAYAQGAVRVQLDDPRDPTPYWLVSSQRPAELAAALRTLLARTRG